jgi:hypothetical protein
MKQWTTLMAVAVSSLAGCGGADAGGPDAPTGVVGGATSGSTPYGHSSAESPASIEDSSAECSSYRGYTAALAKATIDCLGTVNPFLYGLNAKGLLERRFDECTTGGSKPLESPGLLRIDRLLSLQLRQSTLPNVLKCIPEVYDRAQRAFVNQGNSTCPAWTHQSTKGLPTIDNVRESVRRLPSIAVARGNKPTALPTESFHYYSVAYEKDAVEQPCGSAESCARACTAVFPGFYVGMSEKQLIGDPYWWLDPTDYGGFDIYNDPYNRVTGFYHPMSMAGDDLPGEIYGDFARGAFEGANTPDPDGQAELCTRWDGTDHRMARLIQDRLLDDPSTWLSRCELYPAEDAPVF